MKVVVAIDSFKGSLSSVQAGNAVREGVLRAVPEAEVIVRPVADGGEGTVDALVEGLAGEKMPMCVTGPLGEPVRCAYGMLPAGWRSWRWRAQRPAACAAGKAQPAVIHDLRFG